MERKVIITGDGSTTIHLPEWNEQYHSKHGAIQEAYHVFIKHGLRYFAQDHQQEELTSINILEIGFGTGLNALITLLESEKLNLKIDYVGVEAYPVEIDEIKTLNYADNLKMEASILNNLHTSAWEQKIFITNNFSLTKLKKHFETIDDQDLYHIIYFDAFGARVQPELWTESIFKKMYDALKVNGVLVTYAAKGSVRRAMQAVGFKVEKLPGPPGKREMLRAIK